MPIPEPPIPAPIVFSLSGTACFFRGHCRVRSDRHTAPLAESSPTCFSTTVLLTTLVLELILALLAELASRTLGEGLAKSRGGEVYTVTKQARGVVYLT
jgi:hypothetical protein